MTFHVVIGTKAQWIKMAPVLIEMRRRGLALRVIDSGQHAEVTRRVREHFSLPEPDLYIGGGTSVKTIGSGLKWLATISSLAARSRKALRKSVFSDQDGMVLVHGDNLTTAIGVALAFRAGLPFAIVEAGLRSGHPLHPFPEELLRVILPRAAGLLFAPSQTAVDNLKKMKVRGRVVYTAGNTIADALRLVLGLDLPQAQDYGLWNFHRLETLLVPGRVDKLCRLLLDARRHGPVKFILDLPTRPKLETTGWLERLERAGVELLPVLAYPEFIGLLARAGYVATDGGSIQEECALLGVPCLLLRRKTERPDGLGRNVSLLADMTPETFLSQLEEYRTAPVFPRNSPSALIAKELQTTLSGG